MQKAPPLEHRYSLAGKVVSLDPRTKVAAIEHSDIVDDQGKVWMKAMTMEFPVQDAAEFAKLHVGERIRATVFRREDTEYWIGRIKIDPPAGLPSQP
jgi:Cu/Ag efflux protein CusF